MLRTNDLVAWFEDAVPGISGSMDTLPEGRPNRAFAASISGGLGPDTEEEVLDMPTFTLLVRGVSGGDAEEWGYALDQAWLNAPPEFYIGDYQVKGKGRFSGPPSGAIPDASEEFPGRVVRSATYWCRIAR